MPTFTRVTRNEFPATDPTRRGQTDVAYVYTDERFQTYTIILPLADDTEENVKQRLREASERAAQAGPRTVEI